MMIREDKDKEDMVRKKDNENANENENVNVNVNADPQEIVKKKIKERTKKIRKIKSKRRTDKEN
jgi:hypothetical protein